VLFESVDSHLFFLQPTPAIRVNRQDAQHTLLVGDRERTSGEMNVWLHEHPGRRRLSWWLIALVLGGAGLLFLAWYFLTHGWATGNQLKF
jgi:hypothetical protein